MAVNLTLIADNLTSHFANVYQQTYDQRNETMHSAVGVSNPCFDNVGITKLAKSNASGPDDLSAEHIIYAHPIYDCCL